jgi:ADP-ribosylglycohydrolase
MYGAILGDICGSIYEWKNRKTTNPDEILLIDDRCRFTDDTVLTVAIADAVKTDKNYKKALYDWANRYHDAGYGPSFAQWFRMTDPQPYNSWGNGSAMRVSPVGWAFDDAATVLEEAKRSAEPTHNHPEGIKGAQSVALAIFLARKEHDKQQIKERIQADFGYDLNKTLADIRPTYQFDVSCQGSVPIAIIAFLESSNFVTAIQNAISVGGDSDTIAAIAGSIAEAFYKEIPEYLKKFARSCLTKELKEVLGIS